MFICLAGIVFLQGLYSSTSLRDILKDRRFAEDYQYGRERSFMDIIVKQKEREELCKEVATFAPDMCKYQSAQQFCQNTICQAENKEEMLQCGKKNNAKLDGSSSIYKRIIGGHKSKKGEWPWIVSLWARGKDGKMRMWCAGTILSKNFVLTAGMCFNEYTSESAEDWVVTAGDHLLSQEEESEQTIQVKKIIHHTERVVHIKNTSGKEFAIVGNDIAILQLKKPLRVEDNDKSSLCLPEDDDDNEVDPDCHIAGWGYTKYQEGISGKPTNELRCAKVGVVSSKECNDENVYNGTVNTEETFCAGTKDGSIDACNFDGGGPLACHGGSRWEIRGIVSSGYMCAQPNAYGLYTRVSKYKEWIINQILNTQTN